MIAKGFHQVEGIDYFETFSSVAKGFPSRVVFSIALSKGWTLRQLDVINTFLNGELEEAVYMTQPKSFEVSSSVLMVCKLNKALYGLKQVQKPSFRNLLLVYCPLVLIISNQMSLFSFNKHPLLLPLYSCMLTI